MPRKLSKIPRPGSEERLERIRKHAMERPMQRVQKLIKSYFFAKNFPHPENLRTHIDEIKLAISTTRAIVNGEIFKLRDERLEDLIQKVSKIKKLDDIIPAYDYATKTTKQRNDFSSEKKRELAYYYLGKLHIIALNLILKKITSEADRLRVMEN